MGSRKGKSKESRGLESLMRLRSLESRVTDEIEKGKYRRLREGTNWRIFIDLKSMKRGHQDSRVSSTVAMWEGG